MTDDALTRAAAARPGKKLAKVIGGIAKARPQPTEFMIPVISGLPDADGPANMWINPAGNLFWYTWDGVLVSAGLRAGYTAGGAAVMPVEPDLQTYQVSAVVGGSSVNGTGQIFNIACICPTHGVEAGGRYGYHPDHGNRRLIFNTYFGTAINVAGGIGPVFGAGIVRNLTIKVRNVATFTDGPVELHFGLTNGVAGVGTPTYRDVLVDTWPAEGYGGDLDGEHALPIGIAADDVSGAPNSAPAFMISQPDDLASAGELDTDSIEVKLTWTDQVYP